LIHIGRKSARNDRHNDKDIIVNLTVDAPGDIAGDYAISVARTFEAHLSGIAFAHEPVVPGSIFGSAAVRLIEKQRAEGERRARTAVSKFDDRSRGAGLSAESHLLKASLATAADTFARLARRFDISIVTQAEPDKSSERNLVIESALFDSGRPILIVPYIQRDGIKLDHATVCWDGSRNAARAVADALPFLARANKVEVLIVAGDPAKGDEIAGADIAHHLARHDLKVELKQIVVREIDVTNAILSHCADVGVDFVVMGGYGHSRLREFVLGGATRGMLATMTVPTLMSH
jgi:nucleotide-binding universal stress UspA family protein